MAVGASSSRFGGTFRWVDLEGLVIPSAEELLELEP